MLIECMYYFINLQKYVADIGNVCCCFGLQDALKILQLDLASAVEIATLGAGSARNRSAKGNGKGKRAKAQDLRRDKECFGSPTDGNSTLKSTVQALLFSMCSGDFNVE